MRCCLSRCPCLQARTRNWLRHKSPQGLTQASFVKRKDDLIVLNLPRASLGGSGFRTLHEVAAVVVVNDNGVGQLIDSDVLLGRRRLAAFELCRESSIERRSGRYGILELLSVVLIGIQPDINRRRIPIDRNRIGLRNVIGAHGGCAVKNCGGEANQNEDQGRHTKRPRAVCVHSCPLIPTTQCGIRRIVGSNTSPNIYENLPSALQEPIGGNF